MFGRASSRLLWTAAVTLGTPRIDRPVVTGSPSPKVSNGASEDRSSTANELATGWPAALRGTISRRRPAVVKSSEETSETVCEAFVRSSWPAGSWPICERCQLDMRRLTMPMTSHGSPYSSVTQVGDIITGVAPEVQRAEFAWWAPRLWPISWPTTDALSDPFVHVRRPGSCPSPPKSHSAVSGRA